MRIWYAAALVILGFVAWAGRSEANEADGGAPIGDTATSARDGGTADGGPHASKNDGGAPHDAG